MRRKWGFGGLRLLAISLFHEDSNNILFDFLCAKIDTLAKRNRNTYFRNGPSIRGRGQILLEYFLPLKWFFPFPVWEPHVWLLCSRISCHNRLSNIWGNEGSPPKPLLSNLVPPLSKQPSRIPPPSTCHQKPIPPSPQQVSDEKERQIHQQYYESDYIKRDSAL